MRTTLVGTYNWMAPEVIKMQPYGNKADIWSFGIVIFELLVGEPPYADLPPEDVTQMILCNDMVQYTINQTDKLDPLVKELLHNCLQKEQDQRQLLENSLNLVRGVQIARFNFKLLITDSILIDLRQWIAIVDAQDN